MDDGRWPANWYWIGGVILFTAAYLLIKKHDFSLPVTAHLVIAGFLPWALFYLACPVPENRSALSSKHGFFLRAKKLFFTPWAGSPECPNREGLSFPRRAGIMCFISPPGGKYQVLNLNGERKKGHTRWNSDTLINEIFRGSRRKRRRKPSGHRRMPTA